MTGVNFFRRCIITFHLKQHSAIHKPKVNTTQFFILLFFFAASVYHFNSKPLTDSVMSSYCSEESDNFGPNQSVISYSLYGDFTDDKHYARYAEPIKYILSNISQVYPGLVGEIILLYILKLIFY